LYFPFPYINARHPDEGGTLYFSSTNPEASGRTACRKTRSSCIFRFNLLRRCIVRGIGLPTCLCWQAGYWLPTDFPFRSCRSLIKRPIHHIKINVPRTRLQASLSRHLYIFSGR